MGFTESSFSEEKNPALLILWFLFIYFFFNSFEDKVKGTLNNAWHQNALSEVTEFIMWHILNIGKGISVRTSERLSRNQWVCKLRNEMDLDLRIFSWDQGTEHRVPAPTVRQICFGKHRSLALRTKWLSFPHSILLQFSQFKDLGN